MVRRAGRVDDFPLLDSYQLVKHYLGLRKTYPEHQLTLIYLYWEPRMPTRSSPSASTAPRSRGSSPDLVEGDPTCRLIAASYTSLWHGWAGRSDSPGWLPKHVEMLARRYVVEVRTSGGVAHNQLVCPSLF